MTILVTRTSGRLGSLMRIVTRGLKDKYIFTDVRDELPESVRNLHKLMGEYVDTSKPSLKSHILKLSTRMLCSLDKCGWSRISGEIRTSLNAKRKGT